MNDRYPISFNVDYPDRDLDRLTTGLRIFTVIPIAIVLASIGGWSGQYWGGWDDSTTSNECPGGTPLTIAARRHYEVHDLEPHGQGTALRVTRTSDVRINGAGAQRGLPLSVGGGGTGRTELLLDPQAGRLLGSTSEYEVSVTIEAAGARHEIAQRVRQTVELIER